MRRFLGTCFRKVTEFSELLSFENVELQVSEINSPIVVDMFENFSERVLDVPCVQQPTGHSCGMASLINAMCAFACGSHDAITQRGIPTVLEKFGLPANCEWSNFDFCSALNVLVGHYAEGPGNVPNLDTVLETTRAAIKDARKAYKEQEKAKKQRKKRKQAPEKASASKKQKRKKSTSQPPKKSKDTKKRKRKGTESAASSAKRSRTKKTKPNAKTTKRSAQSQPGIAQFFAAPKPT